MEIIFSSGILLVCAFSIVAVSETVMIEGNGEGIKSMKDPKIQQSNHSKHWYECDFEYGYCGWKNDTTAEFEWYRTSQKTPTTETGPSSDHTKEGVEGAGHYLYIETSVPRKKGDRARLVGPVIRDKGPFCFRFWHNMHGSDVQDLYVKVRSRKSRRETTVSHLSGPWSVGSNRKELKDEARNWWNHESVDIDVKDPVEIIIEGISGKNYKGDIAIDDIVLQKGICPRQQSNCDFENNTCGWTQMAEDEFNWLPNRGKTQTLKTGPSYDHTLKTDRGRYLYIETSWPRVEGDKARLLSPKIECDKGASATFNFWYHMNGAHTGPLKIYVTNDKSQLGNAVWEKTGNQGNQWFHGLVKISTTVISKGSFYVVIEAERENFEGDIAIDDLSFAGCRSDEVGFGTPQVLTATTPATTRSTTKPATMAGGKSTLPPSLPDEINCDFEQKNLCSWEQIKSDDSDWIIHRSNTQSSHTGPSSDHTTGRGLYVYFEASSPRKTGDTAILRSRPLSPIHVCVSFYYHMRGKSMGSLELLTVRRGGMRHSRRWMIQGQQSRNGTDWKYGQATITETQPYRMVFRATRGTGFHSDIALDDIKVHPNPCKDEVDSPDSGQRNPQPIPTGISKSAQHIAACDFATNSTCRWRQLGTRDGDFDWTIASSKTETSDYTGPKVDHTSGSRGNYIYIDASAPSKEGDSVKLISASFKVHRPQCFRFWYHMYGAGIGNLTFYRRIKKKPIVLWENGGEKGDSWFEGMFDLQVSKQTVLLVEATRGSEWSGDIALDDFSVTDGKCPTTDCDFEVDNCGWIQEEMGDQFNWTRHSGKTKSKNTGPTNDHTLKDDSGTYLYIEASNKQRYDKAWIRSPIIDPKFGSEKCLTFWYHSFGENVGSLAIHTVPPNSNITYLGSSLWVNAKNQGDQWIYATVNIRETLPYQILIQGIVGLDYLGDIAIDDIHVKDGSCNPCCGNNKFRCGNNFCIHKSDRCNGIDDCGDDSDESFCDSAAQPKCGMPYRAPIVREFTETVDNIQRDETGFETFAIPEEHAPPTVASNDTWEGALKIPFAQASLLKHPLFVAHPPKIPVSVGFYADDMILNLHQYNSEILGGERTKRSAGDSIDIDEDDWIDVLRIQEKGPTIMKHEVLTLSEHKYKETKKEVTQQFGHRHKISETEWKLMRGKAKKSKSTTRMKRSLKKIIGGTKASSLNYPWQVAYYITDSSTNSHFFCGGTLFNRYWVLTAAHCPYLGDLHNIVLGDYDLYKDEGTEQEMLVDAIFLRNKFKLTEEMVGDIALIKLRYPAKQSHAIQLACILSDNQEPFKEGHPCVTTGWGRRDSNTPGIERFLIQAEMPIIANSHCKAAFWSSFKIHDSYICAGGNGANSCKGDSGGPLVCKNDDGLFYLAGITSWGDARCSASIPGVFTRVQSYNDWIKKIMKKHGVCGSS